MNRYPPNDDNAADPNENPEPNEDEKEFQELIEGFTEAKLAGRDEEALEKMMEVLAWVERRTKENTPADLLLMQEAEQLEGSGDWAGAEKAHREVLKLKEVDGNQGMIAKAHHDLSRHWLVRGRLDEAWESALAATAAGRRCEISLVLAMMLENEAWCALVCGEPDRALRAVEEALGALEVSPLTEGIRSRLRMTQARAFVTKGLWLETERALGQARELMGRRKPVSFIPGPLSLEASGWEVEAALRAGLGNGKGAVEAWRKAVNRWRQYLAFPHLSGPYTMSALARALEGLSRELAAQGLPEEAAASRDEAAIHRRWIREGRPPPPAPLN